MRPAGRRWTWVVLAAVLVAACAFLVTPVRHAALRTAGHLLVAEDPMEKADIAVMPVWSGLTGVVESARLVRAGMTTRVAVIAGPKDPAEIEMIRAGIGYEDDADRLIGLLRKLGVSEAMRVDETAAGTEAEARVLADWSNRHGFVTMIVVSTPDHSRRLRRVLRRSMHGHRTRVMVRAATAATFDPDRWWESRDGVRIGVLELEKLVFDIIRHPWS